MKKTTLACFFIAACWTTFSSALTTQQTVNSSPPTQERLRTTIEHYCQQRNLPVLSECLKQLNPETARRQPSEIMLPPITQQNTLL